LHAASLRAAAREKLGYIHKRLHHNLQELECISLHLYDPHIVSRNLTIYRTYLTGQRSLRQRQDDLPEVDVGSLGLTSHTSVGRLDGIGGAVLLVSDLVLPPHLRRQRELYR